MDFSDRDEAGPFSHPYPRSPFCENKYFRMQAPHPYAKFFFLLVAMLSRLLAPKFCQKRNFENRKTLAHILTTATAAPHPRNPSLHPKVDSSGGGPDARQGGPMHLSVGALVACRLFPSPMPLDLPSCGLSPSLLSP